MPKSQSIAVATILAVVLFNASRAEARGASDERPFRFNYSQTELRTERGVRAVEGRLRTEVARFCRDQVASEVMRLGCERSLGRSARQALRERVGARATDVGRPVPNV